MNRDKTVTSSMGTNRESLLAILKRAQSEHHSIPDEKIAEIARSFDIPVNEVYGVVTFYSFLSREMQGRNVIRICKSVPCYLNNSQMIIKAVKDEIGILPGETTADCRFSFELVNCIGACDRAPAMLVNDDIHGSLTPDRIPQILKSYK